MAKGLFLKYYEDHSMYFDGLQNLVLHLHLHYDRLFDQHGSLCYLGTFSQEDFIGAVSKNHHGSRFHGDLIAYYYEVSQLNWRVISNWILYAYTDWFRYAKCHVDEYNIHRE